MKILTCQISRNSVQWEFKLFHADGQTDKTKLIVDNRNFADVPQNTRPLKYTSPSKLSPAATANLYSLVLGSNHSQHIEYPEVLRGCS
jgi:hypothetical protein